MPDPETLWQEADPLVGRAGGLLVLDDSTLDKPYAKAIDLVTRHWSGKHHAVVRGINLITLLWTDGDRHIPCDYRLYDKGNDGLTKNDHFRAMLEAAHARGFSPACVAFDGWYSGLENLKQLRPGLAMADAAEEEPPGQPRQAGAQGRRSDGDRGRRHRRPPGRLRSDPGLQDRLPRRGH